MRKLLGNKFSVIKHAHAEEPLKHLSPKQLVLHHAISKARSVRGKIKKGVIIAADTIVVCNGKILGKPKDKKDAARMLRMISGRIVRVITGVAVMRVDRGTRPRARTDYAITFVKIKKLSKNEIDSYVKTGEPLDKAGAFAIQGKGGKLIEWIEGDYDNVVGLPTEKLKIMLRKIGYNL